MPPIRMKSDTKAKLFEKEFPIGIQGETKTRTILLTTMLHYNVL